MTPAEKEIKSVNDAYSRALAGYGAVVAARTMVLWESFNRFTAAGRAAMSAAIVAEALAARRQMVLLSVRRAQLVMALTDGTVFPDGSFGVVTLGRLRDEYQQSIEAAGVIRALRAKSIDSGMVVVVDERLGSLAGVVDSLMADAASEVETTVALLGDKRLGRIAKRAGVVTPGDVTTSRNMVAAGVERAVLNGARLADAKAREADGKALGYVRVHNSYAADEPCGFCAMMLSRGPIYRSHSSAGGDDPDGWHTKCHCTVERVASVQDYQSNPKYALNREFETLWDKRIRDKFFGDEARSEWRKVVKDYFGSASAVQAAA